jgi:hypothetical protein
MNRKLLVLAVAGLLAPGVALAQGTGSTAAQNDQTKKSEAGRQSSGEQSLPQNIRQTLKDDGYTNVNVVPGSYIVTAKNKRGYPVTMIIGPHSMTMLTAIPGQDSSAGSTTGTASTDSSDKKAK